MRLVLCLAVVLATGLLAGCGASAKYSVRAVESAFTDHGMKLAPSALSTPIPGAVVLRDGHQVTVTIIVNARRLGRLFLPKKQGAFRHRVDGNLIVFYRAARATTVSAALAELG